VPAKLARRRPSHNLVLATRHPWESHSRSVTSFELCRRALVFRGESRCRGGRCRPGGPGAAGHRLESRPVLGAGEGGAAWGANAAMQRWWVCSEAQGSGTGRGRARQHTQMTPGTKQMGIVSRNATVHLSSLDGPHVADTPLGAGSASISRPLPTVITGVSEKTVSVTGRRADQLTEAPTAI
jgi:hypothetical protein